MTDTPPVDAQPVAATRLPGESPCHFVHGLDGWTNCSVHGWTGLQEQRSRVLVCPGAARAGDGLLREAREAVSVLLDRIDYVNGADAREVVQRVKDAMAALAVEGSER